MSAQQKILWQPTQQFIEQSRLKDYERWLVHSRNVNFKNYADLWQWSIDHLEDFWKSIWDYFDIIHDKRYEQVLSNHKMPGAKWFEGTTLNYAEHIFRHRNNNHPALIFQNETERKEISWPDLQKQAKGVQRILVENGIAKGDCVTAYLPNIPEAITCFLAVNSIGAVWSCCSPDFGVETVIERLSQIKPKMLIAADGYRYNEKSFDKLLNIKDIRDNIKSIKSTLLIPYLDSEAELEDSISWESVLAENQSEALLEFTRVPFDHPIWVLYSSGTTGRPKAITHSHGGVLLEHLKYMAFHNDVREGENFFWFTTTGWMMWNFLQASMLVGATPVLYDGSPGHPDLDALWQMAEELPIHHFGTSAPYLTACMKEELKLRDKFDFSKLKSIGSTGAPLPPETFEWIYNDISEDVWLCSISGGTDVCTAFVGGNPYAPVYKGAIQSRALGCALYAYNQKGEKMEGELGEMVIEKPMPSMPIYFWNDENGERYRSSYFENFPGKWRHGDWIKIFENGSLIIQGRSDATLNRKGVRIGTAEIYNVLDKVAEVKDSLILNLELKDGGDVMPLFVVLSEGVELDDNLTKKVNQELRTQCSPRHVPDAIHEVPDIPYTLSGKKMEVPVKKIFMKMDVSKSLNRDAIRNPEAIDYFVDLAGRLKFD